MKLNVTQGYHEQNTFENRFTLTCCITVFMVTAHTSAILGPLLFFLISVSLGLTFHYI